MIRHQHPGAEATSRLERQAFQFESLTVQYAHLICEKAEVHFLLV